MESKETSTTKNKKYPRWKVTILVGLLLAVPSYIVLLYDDSVSYISLLEIVFAPIFLVGFMMTVAGLIMKSDNRPSPNDQSISVASDISRIRYALESEMTWRKK